MSNSADITRLAVEQVGKICSVHWDIVANVVRFQWARVCATDEEAEMVDCELERAAVPGQPYGARFEGVADYRAGNRENLQVSPLKDFRIAHGQPHSRCFVSLDGCGDLGGSVEFSFSRVRILLAPERKGTAQLTD
jgi:hypothetical protein